MPATTPRWRSPASTAGSSSSDATPSEAAWTCALTGEPLRDPVVASDGHTYERARIRDWLATHEQVLPSGRALGDAGLRSDVALRQFLDPAMSGDADELVVDPITYAPLTDPVLASDGRTYDLSVFRDLFARHDGRSPFTRQALEPSAYRHRALGERCGLALQGRPSRVRLGASAANAETEPVFPWTQDLAAMGLIAGAVIGLATESPQLGDNRVHDPTWMATCATMLGVVSSLLGMFLDTTRATDRQLIRLATSPGALVVGFAASAVFAHHLATSDSADTASILGGTLTGLFAAEGTAFAAASVGGLVRLARRVMPRRVDPDIEDVD